MNSDKKCCGKKCSVIGCMLAGLASGVAIGVSGKIVFDANKKALRKKAEKMLDAMGDLGASAMDLFK